MVFFWLFAVVFSHGVVLYVLNTRKLAQNYLVHSKYAVLPCCMILILLEDVALRQVVFLCVCLHYLEPYVVHQATEENDTKVRSR